MPAPDIATDRLILTPLSAADSHALFAYRSLPEVCRYQSWEPVRVEDAVSFIESLQSVEFDSAGTWFQFGVHLRGSGELIGDLGVHFLEDRAQVEVGFTLAPVAQGRGLGTEAVVGLLDHLFMILRRCWLSSTHHVVDSVRSDRETGEGEVVRQRLLLPLAGLPFLLVLAWRRIRSGVRWRNAALETAFGLYALLAASMVFLPVFIDPSVRAAHAESAARFGSDWFNPVPFHTIGALLRRGTYTQVTLAAGNLGLLLPLGVLAPAAFLRLRGWRAFLAAAAGTAVFIEAVQFLERVAGVAFRSVDIDDVILNTLGAVVGFVLFSVIAWIVGRTSAGCGPSSTGPSHRTSAST